MQVYGEHSRSIPQKIIIIVLELFFLWLSWLILFQSSETPFMGKYLADISELNYDRRIIIFIFSIIVFIRLTFMMIFLLKRKIPWEESLSVPLAFALYYIGYALFVNQTEIKPGLTDILAIGIFLTGSFLNTCSELQRHYWKKKPENKGKLFTKGLFATAMHINFFGDILWVSAYAIVTRNIYSLSVPAFLVAFFVFYNIPKLDNYLKEKYAGEFVTYAQKTKKLIPFIY